MRGFGEKNITAKCKRNSASWIKTIKIVGKQRGGRVRDHPRKRLQGMNTNYYFIFLCFMAKFLLAVGACFSTVALLLRMDLTVQWKLSIPCFFSCSTIPLYVGHFRIESRRVCYINNVQIVSDFHPCYKSSLAKCALAQSPTKRHHTYSHNASVNAQCIDCMWCGGGWLLHGK